MSGHPLGVHAEPSRDEGRGDLACRCRSASAHECPYQWEISEEEPWRRSRRL